MKIVIMGPGAMGSLFGGLLTRAGEELWLVGYEKDQVETICSVGLTFEEKGESQIIPMKATPDVTSVGKADLVIFFVKTYDMEKAVSDSLALEKEDTIFLTLQNGLGNEDLICNQIDRKKVMLGITGHGATLLRPGHIRHAGWGKTFIGELDHQITDRALRITQMFSNAGIDTEVSSNIHNHVWGKLLVNVGINALTALTGFRNGQLVDYPETLRLMERLVSEAAEVARRKGIYIEEDPIDRVRNVAEATRENRSSMGQDFDHRRQTEIDAINGAIVREAQELGIPVPFNQAVTDLVKAIEKTFGQGLVVSSAERLKP
ncbi:MAG TPA: 2-dehydropantoate 2-reductase [Thermodesulfobacteriota bacterium]|nr:2-dehydropantoate 2-reductase [Thermodesulfobacteriota bacterium]